MSTLSALGAFILQAEPSRLLSLHAVDVLIILIYFPVILGIGFYLKRFTKTGDDFFLAGKFKKIV